MSLLLSGLVLLIAIVCVFFIGGKMGAYVWCAIIFVVAPMAVIQTLIQTINMSIRLFKRKKISWNIVAIVISILYALPILVLLKLSPITYPRHAKEEDCIEIMEPVDDVVYMGGVEYKTHAYWPSECYAYDILKEPYDMQSKNLYDYGIFGKDVKCPISGTVIGMENEEPDIKPNSEEFSSLHGNYIFIKIDSTDTYLVLAHFMKDSIVVSVGDHVTEGDVLGKVGNSGTTSEPHLHIQHQRENPLSQKIVICAEGLPIKFK
jgi:hypothetical protein